MLLENVVIGYSVESALFAYFNGFYHIQTCDLNPLFFESYRNLYFLGSNNKKTIWQKVKLHLGLLALNIDYLNISQVRITGTTIKIFDDNLLGEFQFKRCFIFETLNVSHENDLIVAFPETYKVIDDFKVRRLGRQNSNINSFFLGDELVSEIYFYNSMRVDGAKYATDIITVSSLKKSQLYDFDYSDTMAKFKLKKYLESIGIIGLKEKNKYKNGKDIYKKLNLEHVKRHIIPVDNNKYKNSKQVKFMDLKLEEATH